MDYYNEGHIAHLEKENDRLKEALEYQALVNHGYSYLAHNALNGESLTESQKDFVKWAKERELEWRKHD